MSKLFDEVRAGRVAVSSLSGIEYQTLVFERLLELIWTDPSTPLRVDNQAQGPVDYVVHEAPSGGVLGRARTHYFECKNYGRALELDNVAKIMVVAIAEQPDSVNVVSRTRLQPQISTYASRLFDLGGDGSTPIFKSILFRHWQTDEVLNLAPAAVGAPHRAEVSVGAATRTLAWWITECSAYTETELASSVASGRELALRRGSLLLVTIEVPESTGGRVTLGGFPEEAWSEVSAGLHGDPLAASRYTFLIDTGLLVPGSMYRLSARISTATVQSEWPIASLQFADSGAVLPELRPRATKDLSTKLGPAGQHRLALVDGDAGVGKTHFVQKVAEGLRARFGFDVTAFTVTREHQDALLTSLLDACLTPPLHRENFQEVAAAVRRALLSKDIDARALEAHLGLLARVATRTGPRMFVLRDCHLLNETVANQLWALVVALDDAGWGGARLVLEYRQPDAAGNEACHALITRIRQKIRRVLVTKTLVPLTAAELAASMQQLFQHVTPEITDALLRRTGGLPLFIDSYLQRLLELGIVGLRGHGSPALSILQPAQLLADTGPADGSAILRDRVRASLRAAFGNDDARAVEVGLIALSESADGQAWMREALGISPERLTALQLALNRANLAHGRPDGQIVFHHDLLRTSVVSEAATCADFEAAARTAAQRLLVVVGARDLGIRQLRARIFSLIGDRVALEVELRLGARAAKDASDYGHLTAFLTQLLELLPDTANDERLALMSDLAWAAWVSDSLVAARRRYLQLADEAQRSAAVDFSLAEAAATDALRRAIGIDLELMEPVAFLENALAVLKRRQTLITFNSIMNRLVLFCARFGYPAVGFDLAALAFNYIGNGLRENEGAVLCSELGALHVAAEPEAALGLFREGIALARDDCQGAWNQLDALVAETLHLGRAFDEDAFERLWRLASEHHFSEVLTRASLLRGSICLRTGDLAGARHWTARTWTLVNLYHLKEFELPALNDMLVLSVLTGDTAQAQRHLANFMAAFDALVAERSRASKLVTKLAAACEAAAQKLPIEPAALTRPMAAPRYCGCFFLLWRNLTAVASALDVPELVQKYGAEPEWLEVPEAASGHRRIAWNDRTLTVGAY